MAERETGLPRVLLAVVALAACVIVAFLAGRATVPVETNANPRAPADPTRPASAGDATAAQPTTSASTSFHVRSTTTLLTKPAAGEACTAATKPDQRLSCLRRQRDDLETAMNDAMAGASARVADARARARAIESAEHNADIIRRLDLFGEAQTHFLDYRRTACAWAATAAVRSRLELASEEELTLACANAVTSDRVNDLRLVAAGAPLASIFGWQHPMPHGRDCESDRYYENDLCGSPDLRAAEARLVSALGYLFVIDFAGEAHEATAAWMKFETADCHSRLALFLVSYAPADATACKYESFVRFLAILESGVDEIISVD